MDWAEQCAGIRKRPGMYVGDTNDGSGLLNMAMEVLSNAADQYLLGHCKRIDVRLEADGSVTIEDDGPGFAPSGPASLETVLTTLRTTPTADGHRPHLHLAGGSGLATVNALSERFEAASVRDGTMRTIRFVRGEVVEPLTSGLVARPAGTRIRFRADRVVFGESGLRRAALSRRLEELNLLTPGLVLSWSLAGEEEAGADLSSLVALDAPNRQGDVAHHRGTYDVDGAPIQVEVALAWSVLDDAPRIIHSFANYRRTTTGVHVMGLLDGLAAEFRGTSRRRLQRGLVAAVSVVLADVIFGSPVRDRLLSPTVREPVAQATRSALARWRAAHPDAAATLRHDSRGDADGSH